MACIGLVSCNHLSTLLINKKCVKRLKFDQNFHFYLVLAAILDSYFIFHNDINLILYVCNIYTI